MTVPRTISKRMAIFAGGGVLVLAVAAWGVSSHFRTPVQAPVDPEKLMEEMRKPGLTDQQREELDHKVHEAREAEMDARVKEYFNASSEDQKIAILDKQIDEFEKRRKEWEERRNQAEEQRNQGGDQPPPGAGPRDGPTSRPFRDRWAESTPQERKTRSESRDADQMAQRMAYFQAMRARMEARGIRMPFGPGGRGPGGGGRGGPGGHRGGPPH